MRRLNFVMGLTIVSMTLPCTLHAGTSSNNDIILARTSAKNKRTKNKSPRTSSIEPKLSQALPPPTRLKKRRLAVMDVKLHAKDIDPVVAESLSSVLAAELSLRGADRYEVVSRNDLRRIMQHQVEAQLLGCNEPKCLADLGSAASADHIVTATLGKIEDSLVFTLELIDVPKAIVISRQSVTWHGPQSGIVELCRPYVERLLDGPKAAQYQGAFEIIVNEKDALVHLNNRELGLSPVSPVGELSIGKHSLQIVKDGYLPYKTDFVINRNETTLLTIQLIDEDSIKPWYAKWWFWTGTAAVVGAAITAAVMLRDKPSTTVDIRSPLPL